MNGHDKYISQILDGLHIQGITRIERQSEAYIKVVENYNRMRRNYNENKELRERDKDNLQRGLIWERAW